MRLSEAAFKFSTGNGKLESIHEAFGALGVEVDSSTEDAFETTDLVALLSDHVQKPGLRFRLNFLNKSLGSLRKGDFGFIFARPETGKTTFLASEITAMLKQLKDEDGPIIWFNNEEQNGKVLLRVYQAYFGVTLQQLLASPNKYADQFAAETRGKFLMPKEPKTTKAYVERLLKLHRPSLIIYDQIDKIEGFAADREDLMLGEIYKWARDLAKIYAPSIGVCQADGTGEGQKWLTMANVANAKTSKQAEADWILGIGCVHGEGTQAIRYLNISKNKLSGDTDTLERLRHGRSEVLIEPHIARYRDIIKDYG